MTTTTVRVGMHKINRKPQCPESIKARLILALALMPLILILTCLISFVPSNSPEFTYQEVIVQPGDTLWELTVKSNQNADIQVQILVSEAMKYNNLPNTYIQPGQILYIPVRL
jgi:uncharacterized protein YqhQ